MGCWCGANVGLLPLVTREALAAFTQRLVEAFAPQMVILFGSQARGEARWDSNADLLVVMPYEGQPRDTVQADRKSTRLNSSHRT